MKTLRGATRCIRGACGVSGSGFKSADGGTGAAPMALMDFMGLPIQESLPLVVDCLNKHKLKKRVQVIACRCEEGYGIG